MSPNAFEDEIWRMSPRYAMAYEEGYKAAKEEMRQLIKSLEAFKTYTATFSPLPNE